MVQHTSEPDARDKVVVITGASSGIGRAAAELFARDGARLVLAARDEAALRTVADGCRQRGGQAMPVAVDVTDAGQVARPARAVLSRHGRIDVRIADVGIGAVGLFHEVPMTAHEQVLRTNLLGYMHEAHAVPPVFLEQGRGIFISMNSLGGFVATPYAAAYSASKFGLRGLSEALRAELAGHSHIHVCDVHPSFVDTPGIGHGANRTGRALSGFLGRYLARARPVPRSDGGLRSSGSSGMGAVGMMVLGLGVLALIARPKRRDQRRRS